MFRILYITLFILGSLYSNTITLSDKIDRVIVNKIQYLKNDNYTLQDLVNKQFRSYHKKPNALFRFPFENETFYWVKVELKNISHTTLNKYLHIDNANISSVEFYEFDTQKNSFVDLKRDLKKQRTFVYNVTLQKEQKKIILIKFYNQLSPTIFRLNIYNKESFILKEQTTELLHGLFLGFMSFAIAYFILASIFMKKAFYIFYIIHIFAISAFLFFIQGYPKVYFEESTLYPQLEELTGVLSFGSFSIFTFYFLQDKLSIFYKRLFILIILLVIILTPLYMSNLIASQILAGVLLFGYISIIFGSLDSYLRKNYHAIAVLIASIVIVVGALIHASAIIFQIIPLNNFTANSLIMSNIIEVFAILFSFMLYLKKTDREKQNILSQKIKIEKSFSKNLQLEVNKKTQELKHINQTLNIKVEEAINKAKEQERLLFSQSKLATMGETISIIAHQWRNPISILSSHINHMELSLKYKKEFDQKDFLSTIKKSQDVLIHLSSTIDVFQNYLKPSSDELNSSFKLVDVIQKGLLLYKDSMKNDHIEVFEKFEIKDINIKGNSEDFIQVLISLFSNSKDALIKNTKNNKKIIIIKTKLKNDRVYIDIYDNGGGIFVKPIQQIFEPYFTSKKENGFGLGLFIAREIVIKKLNGKIKVKSKLRSTIFTIELPV